MILPCKCKGDLSYIHEKCFLNWVNINSQNTLINESTIKCDVCLDQINFTGCWAVEDMKLIDRLRKSENLMCGLNLLLIEILLGYFIYQFIFEDFLFAAVFWVVPFIMYGIMQVLEIKEVWFKKTLQSINFKHKNKENTIQSKPSEM